ncbi:MAG: glycoside hydrolase family 32 protein [Micrococcales bacterium]|nr:glycoside hydrolase family 32 protein [Micrococcales bacterium]
MRPLFHFTAPTGWINDPHGIVWRAGRYHAFFQYVPDSMVWDLGCRWGHATGPDLLSLIATSPALEPGDGDDGIWTGSLVVDDAGDATILYTSVRSDNPDAGRIRVARPTDDGWERWEKGPVVLTPPADLDLVAFRDPFITRDVAGWRMLVGGGLRDGTALALGYRSIDLERWEPEGVVASRSRHETDGTGTGAIWECPQLVELDGRHVLITSVWTDGVLDGAGYGVGRLRDGRFEAGRWGRLSFGPSYYAPSFYRDAAGRPCLLFWMRGVRDESENWNGAHSIPYLLSLDGDRLVVTPHPDLDRYLGTAAPAPDGTVIPDGAADLRWGPAAGDTMRLSAGGQQVLSVAAEPACVVLFAVDGTSSMPWSGGPLRIVLDGPVVEIVSADGVLGGALAATSAELTLTASGPAPVLRALRR